MCVCTYACMYGCMYVCMHVCMCVLYVCVCLLYVCMCVYVYVCPPTLKRRVALVGSPDAIARRGPSPIPPPRRAFATPVQTPVQCPRPNPPNPVYEWGVGLARRARETISLGIAPPPTPTTPGLHNPRSNPRSIAPFKPPHPVYD